MTKSFLLAFGLGLLAGGAQGEPPGCTKQSFGAGVTIADATPLDALLDRPDEFVGRRVRVEGTVVDVCAAAGCWLELRAGEAGRSVRVKVEDGEIVFPVAARGRTASAEGDVEALEMSRERYLDYRHHIADETGVEFDPAAVEGEGPFRVLQIRGRGAEICL